MAAEKRAVLYAFWLSSCSWRVRAALHAKRIPFEERPINILKKEQHTDTYRAISPSQKVPALVIDNVTIVESMAILQYLEDTRPHPSLVPSTPLLRAQMREIVETVVSGIQPLQNVGLRQSFEKEEDYTKFTKYWTARGLQTLEDILKKNPGKYCIGDHLTMADICVMPQLYNATSRHKLDLRDYPAVFKLYKTLVEEDLFLRTHPVEVKK